MLKRQIEDFCKSIGLDTVGFIKCRRVDGKVTTDGGAYVFTFKLNPLYGGGDIV